MKNFVRIFIIIFISFLCFSCSTTVKEIKENTIKIAIKNGLSDKIYETKKFNIFTLQKIKSSGGILRVYIEGDGKSFINKNSPSFDPTPRSYFLINLVTEDDFLNLIYIARPCQFVTNKYCEVKYWTNARFSEEVIDSINEVLEKFPNYKLELVGFSGGGAIAKYIAARNKNVINFRTIAGNLDHEKFAEIHRVSSLNESLQDNQLILQKLSKVPQIHFVGKNDKIVPKIIAETYLKNLPQKNCVKIINVDRANHHKGWKDKWKSLLTKNPTCN